MTTGIPSRFTGRHTANRVGPTRLRILALIVAATERGAPLTVRELAKLTGVYVNAVNGHVKALKRDGMVTSDPGQCRTLRATCEFLTLDELEEAS